jgi:hypothetical protein
MLEGVAFMRSMADTWQDRFSFMRGHNWWHTALFLVDLDRTDEALDAWQQHIWTDDKDLGDNQANAISLLARLELRGVDVGERWAGLAPFLKTRLHEHYWAFLDLHYLYALARAGEQSAVTEMLASLEDRAEAAPPSEREVWADCAVPAAHGLQALPHLQPLGGSIAQRALFHAVGLDAMIHSGWNDAALKVLQADDQDRPTVPNTKRALGALLRKLGRAEQAMAAEYQAEQLSKRYKEMAT